MRQPNANTLLVLAASTYQLDTIRTAKSLGYRVITSDNRPSNPGHALADQAYNIDTRDCGAVLEMAKNEEVTGVLAPCTDIALPTAAIVADALGLHGPPPASAAIACDKANFRKFQAEHLLPHPRFLTITSVDVFPDFEGLSKGIVKPCQSSGSKGIKVFNTIEELREALPAAFQHSLVGSVIIEEFLPGFQGTCEGWLSDGKITWSCLLDRQTVSLPFVATCGHHVPTALQPRDQTRVIQAIEDTWRRLGVTDGPFDCDFVLNDTGVYVIELSPRLGGNAISQLVRLACNFDLVEHTVRWACGDVLGSLPTSTLRPTAAVILGADGSGILHYNEAEVKRIADEPWVHSIHFDFPIGAECFPFTDGSKRVGQALVSAASRSALDKMVDSLRDAVAIRVKSHHSSS